MALKRQGRIRAVEAKVAFAALEGHVATARFLLRVGVDRDLKEPTSQSYGIYLKLW